MHPYAIHACCPDDAFATQWLLLITFVKLVILPLSRVCSAYCYELHGLKERDNLTDRSRGQLER